MKLEEIIAGFASLSGDAIGIGYRDPGAPDHDAFLAPNDRVLKPQRERALVAERVIVLQGPFTVVLRRRIQACRLFPIPGARAGLQ